MVTFDTPAELFSYRLGSALTMERDVAELLDAFARAARGQELRLRLREHVAEAGRHALRIEQAAGLLGIAIEDRPCPAIEAIAGETRAQLRRVDDALVDDTILAGAAAAEHHEIAVYEWLIAYADTLGAAMVATLLRDSLEQERRALTDVLHRISAKAHVPVRRIIGGAATRPPARLVPATSRPRGRPGRDADPSLRPRPRGLRHSTVSSGPFTFGLSAAAAFVIRSLMERPELQTADEIAGAPQAQGETDGDGVRAGLHELQRRGLAAEDAEHRWHLTDSGRAAQQPG